MEDALSANSDLEGTHFENHHTYRLEWQPGDKEGGGFLEWYLDSEFIFRIPGSSLQDTTGSMIPVEPMYLIANTAISHKWGMPEPCDRVDRDRDRDSTDNSNSNSNSNNYEKNKCGACWVCYDCTNPECQCSLPQGMQGCRNLPAEMEIDFIRLYQDPLDPKHTLGCSPPQYPTHDWITSDAHKHKYADWEPYNGPAGKSKYKYKSKYKSKYRSRFRPGISLEEFMFG